MAFTAFDTSETWSLDPSYGELVFNKYSWGYKEDGQPFVGRSILPTHNCTREELNLDGDGELAKFYPAHESSRTFLE